MITAQLRRRPPPNDLGGNIESGPASPVDDGFYLFLAHPGPGFSVLCLQTGQFFSLKFDPLENLMTYVEPGREPSDDDDD